MKRLPPTALISPQRHEWMRDTAATSVEHRAIAAARGQIGMASGGGRGRRVAGPRARRHH
jgi:hypothetical protein